MNFTYIKQLENITSKHKFEDPFLWYKLFGAGYILITEYEPRLNYPG